MPDRDIYQAILAAHDASEPVVLATVVRTRGAVPRRAGTHMLIYEDGRFLGTIGGGEMERRVIQEARNAIETGEGSLFAYDFVDPEAGDVGVCGGTMEVYVEPLLPEPTVVVIGCGHVGKAVATLAKWAGFRVVVTDDRAEFCNPDFIPDADVYLPVPTADVHTHIPKNRWTYIAALTRGSQVDQELLPPLLDSPVPYIGCIGSRRRWAVTAEALRERGVTEAQLARVHSPIGLELNAETPEEIAVSIVAEIIMVMRGGTGERMKMELPPAPERRKS
ncbi:MAG: XdhC/CoxI family protein [Anaerolineae bacterium]